jgi:very-short-patch-repair endonuclease
LDRHEGKENHPVKVDQGTFATNANSVLLNALAQQRLKLLDLSGRNRLINFKHTPGKSLQFIEGQLSVAFNKLVEDGQKLEIQGLPEPAKADWVENNGRSQRPEARDWARAQNLSTSYDIEPRSRKADPRALMYRDDLAKHCRKIEREAVLAVEETGANMLFLVLGFLEFPDQKDSDRLFTAPLVCVPVTMLKKDVGGVESFSIQHTDEEVADNLSLREKLRNDFGYTIPEIPEENANVDAYLDEIASIVKTNPRFAVKRRVSLCLLSFANMLMVRDLDPAKWPSGVAGNVLLDHPIIRQIFEGRGDTSQSSLAIAAEHAVEEGPSEAIPLVFDADSSQHSALVDALVLKKNMVIEGPPGTGKSQTITNLIAACLAEGKSVLFVAEKLAALEVVKARLTQAELAPFVLELHSNKTNKKKVLEEINRRIAFRVQPPSELPRLLQQIESHRAELKTYTDIINSSGGNGFGHTLYQVMWRAERHRAALTVSESLLNQIDVPDAKSISEFELTRRMDCLRHLGDQFEAVGGFDSSNPLWGFYPDRLVPGDEFRIEKLLSDAAEWAKGLQADSRELNDFIVGAKLEGLSTKNAFDQSTALLKAAQAVSPSLPFDLIPGFFVADGTGQLAASTLADFENKLKLFAQIESIVAVGLTHEDAASPELAHGLAALATRAADLGAKLGDVDSIEDLRRRLVEFAEKLEASCDAIKRACQQRGIPFDGSRQALEVVAGVAKAIINAPDEHLDLQSPLLAKDGALRSLEALAQLQSQYVEAQSALDRRLYLDALPDSTQIRGAISTLREGDAWYRIFQGRWRSAKKLHHSLLRTKSKVATVRRLSDLEQIEAMLALHERWKSDGAWSGILDHQAPMKPMDLSGHVAVARWNKVVKKISEEVGATPIEPSHCTPEKTRALRREYIALKSEAGSANTALAALDELMPKLSDAAHYELIETARFKSRDLAASIDGQIAKLREHARDGASVEQVLLACKSAIVRATLRRSIEGNEIARRILGALFAGVDTKTEPAKNALAYALSFDKMGLVDGLKSRLRKSDSREAAIFIGRQFGDIAVGLGRLDEFSAAMRHSGELDVGQFVGCSLHHDLHAFATALPDALAMASEASTMIMPWSLYIARRKESVDLPLAGFVDLLERGDIVPSELAAAYGYCAHSAIVRDAFRSIPQLGRFAGLKHNQIREEFKRLDKEIIRLRGKSIGNGCILRASPPDGRSGIRVNERTEMALLNHLLPQQRPRVPVRKMLVRAGQSIQALKPCFMMGPQAVAQYLSPGAVKFDLIIMDEASQLRPEEAIGAIARGGQLVVVGDPNQLPPTSFFSRVATVGDDEDDQFSTTDAESILDVCSGHFHPIRSLRWHYRSQHHSLIAFSNKHFYKSNLIIFPSPYGQGGKLGVRATYLADAVYENQSNLREATRVVEAVTEHIRSRPDDSLGVATLNIKQRDLIAELLDTKLKDMPGVNDYRERWKTEGQPLFVKNLENVQGDERDSIIVSTTFGRPPGSSKVQQNFGPISRQGGWRRLNVLFTRAKKSIAIYTSLRPEDIALDATTPEGTRALRNYLEYARSGSLTESVETGRAPDSDFEVSVLDVLRAKGFECTPQLGVAGYRIDIAVNHPDAPGVYLAAIECDGATYHSAQSVRDRDRIRQEILESMGWRGRIWRIWSTDWFRTPHQETQKLLGFLDNLRKSWRPEYASGNAWVEEGVAPVYVSTLMAEHTDMQSAQIGPPLKSSAAERVQVNSALIDSGEYMEVEVGDTVKYVDINRAPELLTVQITFGRDDFVNGIISHSRPLAQVLLGAVVEDEVQLNLPGMNPRVFRICEIKKP